MYFYLRIKKIKPKKQKLRNESPETKIKSNKISALKNTLSLNILLLISSIALCALITEGALRVIYGSQAVLAKSIVDTEMKSKLCRSSLAELEAQGDTLIRADADFGFTLNISPHGFRDPKNFFDDYSKSPLRVLVLGDSYTEGMTADPGKGYVSLLDKHLQRENRGMVFNTGVRGYSAPHYLAVAKKYIPIVRPHVVVVGFCLINDFQESEAPLHPIAILPNLNVYRFEKRCENDRCSWEERTDQEILDIYRKELPCDNSALLNRSYRQVFREEIISRSVLLRFAQLFWNRNFNKKFSEGSSIQVKETDTIEARKSLAELKKLTDENNIPLVVLAIPMRSFDITKVLRWNFNHLKRITDELDIELLDIFPKLTIDDYITWTNDNHWNNSGHEKAFRLLDEYLKEKQLPPS